MPTKSGKGGTKGYDGLKVRVKSAAKRKESSRRWLQRQLNDPYVAKAKADGYRSRAAYKLLEIDEQYKILRNGQRILDLGAAPGGWTQIAVQRIGAKGSVLGVDILEMEPIPGATLLQLDFLDEHAESIIEQQLGGAPDVVLSDMAANTIGHRATDHLRTMALVEAAAESAMKWLAPNGVFLAKIFQGGTHPDLLTRLRKAFTKVHHVKPKASRAESSEMYVLALGFRGQAEQSSRD